MKRKPLNRYEIRKLWNPNDLPFYLTDFTKSELQLVLLLLKSGEISWEVEE